MNQYLFMKKLVVTLLLFLSYSSFAQQVYTSSGKAVNARKQQKRDKGFDTDKLIYGGWLGLQFGDVTNVYVPITVGYKLTDKFAAGIGVGYQYTKYKIKDEKQNTVSLSAWARYKITDQIFVHIEPQMFNVTQKAYGDTYKFSYNTFLVGGGYRTPITERASVSLMLLYDVLQDANNPNPNKENITPIMGFNIGF